jgi:hypothetical protein
MFHAYMILKILKFMNKKDENFSIHVIYNGAATATNSYIFYNVYLSLTSHNIENLWLCC